jgi:ADP-ribose pyrophosphatase YjhB (NUDIX family)
MDGPRLAVGAIVVRDETLLMVKRDKEPARGL